MMARTAKEFRRKWIPGATVAMIFLLFPAVSVLHSQHPLFWKILSLIVVLVIGASYLFLTPSAMSWPIRKQLGLLVSLLAVSALAWPVLGSSLVGFWIFIGITAGVSLSMRHTAIFVGILAVGMLLLSRVDHQDAPWSLAGTAVGLSLWMCAFMGNIRLTNELRETRQELADAAVITERERIGRDLHDILGHSLTAIAVKAGLARRMVERQSGDAVREIAEVERLAREALADVRATASGYREVSVGAEIALAAMVLRAAGITPRVPVAVDAVDPSARELFGFVVREATTNVIRHSGAKVCTITLGVDWVTIQDDGAGVDPVEPASGGSGLSGLRERVREFGGVLDISVAPGGGFTVHAAVVVPAATVRATASRPTVTPAIAGPGTVEVLR